MVSDITLPGTRLKLTRLGFGTGSLHHRFWRSERVALLEHAANVGLTHIDTSPYYGDGLAETDIGALPAKTRRQLTIATKVGLYPRLGVSRNSLSLRVKRVVSCCGARFSTPVSDLSLRRCRRSLNESLSRMRIDHIHLLLLHEPVWSAVHQEDLLGWLHRERDAGKIGWWGIAGPRDSIEPFLQNHSPLGTVLQTADSLENQEGNFLSDYGRSLQITYGYIRRSQGSTMPPTALTILRAAMNRNSTGSVLVSTRNHGRISEIARLL